MSQHYQRELILLLSLSLLVTGALAVDVPTITVLSADNTLEVGETTTVAVLLDTVPTGLSGFNVTVALTDPLVGELTAITYPAWAVLPVNSPLPADTVYAQAVDLMSSVGAGTANVTLCTLTFRGDVAGKTDLTITATKVDDDVGGRYTPTVTPASITVGTTPTPTPTTELSFTPVVATVTPGDTAQYAVVMNSVPGGLSGFNVSVALTNSSVGEIVAISYPTWANLPVSSSLPADTVYAQAVDLMSSVGAGATNVALCTLTIRGDAAGEANLTITATKIDDDIGGRYAPDTTDATLVVENISPAPVANFTTDATSGTVPLAVQFTDTSTGNPSSWLWTFGDGATSTEQNPIHTYTAAGTYTVNLTVANAVGSDTFSREGHITVLDAMPIGLGDVGAAKGQTTQALLTIRNASAIGAGSLDLTYDPAVVTVDAVDLASPWTGASNIDNANGKARMNYFTAYGQSGDVPICTITFRATGEPGDTSPLNVDVTELVNANGQDITFAALPVPGEFQVLYPNTPDPFRYRDAANLYKGILSGNTLYFGEEGLNLTRLGNVQHLVHYSNFSAGTVDAVIDVPDCRSFDLVARGSPIPGRYYARGDDGLLNGRPWIEIREPCTGLDVLLAGTNTSVNGVTLTDNVTLDFALENNLEGLHTLPAAALMDIEVTTPGGGKLTQFGGVDMRDIPINVSTVYARGVSLNDTDPGSYIARAVWSSASDFAGKGYDSNTVSFEIIRSTIPPAASFMANVTIGTIPLAVAFTDTSTGNVTSWAWDFGDGNTSTDQNPTHTYTAAGTYTVSLNASNAGGSSTETKTDYITVLEPPAAAFTAIPTEGNAPLAVQFTDQSTGNVTAWRWSFGDGSASTDQNPTHTYATAGTYTVSLNASNAYRYSISAPAMITVLEPPTAAFTANVTGGKVPLTVQFTDQSTGNVTAWHWSFGDDTTSTEQSPIHTYRAPGTYTVSLNASNAGSSSTETKTGYITVIVPPPVATFTTSVTEGNAPLTIRFTDTSTGEITAWLWSFGDGATATTRNSTHTYAEVGTYTARLTITGSGGNDAAERIITATPPATGAAFTANITAGLAPLAVQFTDTSSNNPTAWSWTFGDGATSTEQHPTHTYTLPGNHTVMLSVNGGAETCTKPGYIQVTPVLFGDANEDGAINQADTLLVLQEVVGLREKPAADTNRFRKTDTHANGVIEVADALFIAQYNVGLRDVWFTVL